LADVHEPWLARTVITDDLAGDLFEPLSIGTMVRRVADMAVEKASRPWALLMRSLVGGAMVAFGVVLSLVVSTGVTTPGVASLLMGLVFGMSFVLILVSGMSLITADMAAGFLAVLQRRMSASAYCRLLSVGFAGNTIGALIFVAICAAAGGPYLGGFAERAATVGALKAGQPLCTALLLALLCTWFLHTSMCMFFQARSDVARMGFAFYGPFAFVIGGTQHVIANVGFLGLRCSSRRSMPPHRTAGSAGASAAMISSQACASPHSATFSGAPSSWPCRFRSSHGWSSERTKAGVTAHTSEHPPSSKEDTQHRPIRDRETHLPIECEHVVAQLRRLGIYGHRTITANG
jgi:formate transporter